MQDSNKMCAFFPYMGGKTMLLPKLLSIVPYRKIYCEPFFGSGRLFFNRKQSSIEVVNDINKNIVNLMRVVRDENLYQELKKKLEFTLYARDEFNEAMQILNLNNDDENSIKKAWAFFCVIIMSITHCNSRTKECFSISKEIRHGFSEKPVCFYQYVKNLDLIRQRLRFTYIENSDAIEIIQKWDSEDTVFYLDPPYYPLSRKSGEYRHELSVEYHRFLLETVKKCRGFVFLSGYQNDLYNELLKDWELEIIDVPCRISVCTKDRRQEVIWYKKTQGQGFFNWED